MVASQRQTNRGIRRNHVFIAIADGFVVAFMAALTVLLIGVNSNDALATPSNKATCTPIQVLDIPDESANCDLDAGNCVSDLTGCIAPKEQTWEDYSCPSNGLGGCYMITGNEATISLETFNQTCELVAPNQCVCEVASQVPPGIRQVLVEANCKKDL